MRLLMRRRRLCRELARLVNGSSIEGGWMMCSEIRSVVVTGRGYRLEGAFEGIAEHEAR